MRRIKEIRQDRIDEYCKYIGYDAKEDDAFTLEEVDFYLRCKKAGLHYADADRYAILNTLFGYDIGMENAQKIDEWMYFHDYEIYELTYKDKDLIERCLNEIGLNLHFNKFRKDNYDEYEFFGNPEKRDIVQYSFDVEDEGWQDENELMEILEEHGVKVVGAAFSTRWSHDGYYYTNGREK